LYVDLSPAGLGLCPFHDDKVNSFGVNSEGNYWNCFAGGGGGSIIDFWMQYRKCDFTTAVKELTKMLLSTMK
jgi:DNA primase